MTGVMPASAFVGHTEGDAAGYGAKAAEACQSPGRSVKGDFCEPAGQLLYFFRRTEISHCLTRWKK